MLYHSNAVREGDAYRIAMKASSYNLLTADGIVTVIDKLTDRSYDIPVHIISSNATYGKVLAFTCINVLVEIFDGMTGN